MHSEGIEFGGTVSFNDYKKLVFYTRRKSTIIMMACYFLVLFSIVTLTIPDMWVVSFILSLIATLVVFMLAVLFLYFRIRREYASNKLMKQEIRYVASKDGLDLTKGVSNARYEWGDLISAYEYKDLFRLQVSRFLAISLPKRFFENADDINEFRNLIRVSLPEKKVHLSKQQ
ncbi:YcxB family protein [Sporolactobacillus shoreicorticis]|uniref:YcxB family protein n=1 Tax=Sporolactobacillus shoreicorticis TaxID=1923877 RepID=A0ABW5RY18_9BACL|nr:YcxB family protein [Sporolactobacillus shoreicorticis]MCO7125009.1 YcxB family protein [Sporolactobacillus shoreicorticis]